MVHPRTCLPVSDIFLFFLKINFSGRYAGGQNQRDSQTNTKKRKKPQSTLNFSVMDCSLALRFCRSIVWSVPIILHLVMLWIQIPVDGAINRKRWICHTPLADQTHRAHCAPNNNTRAQLLLTWANEWDGRFDDLHMIYAKLQLTKCTICCYASETPSPLQNFLLFFHYNINHARRPTGG